MASNFFQRWSERSLATKDHTATDLESGKDAVVTIEHDAIENSDIENDAIEHAEHISEPQAESFADSPLSNPATDVMDEHIEETLTINDADQVTFDSGVASFLQQGVDKSVKKAALAKLFHSDEFNYISDMDDHTEDFSNIPKLDESIAKQLRGWIKAVVEEPEQEAELIEESEVLVDAESASEVEGEAEAELIASQETLTVDDEMTESIGDVNSAIAGQGNGNSRNDEKNKREL